MNEDQFWQIVGRTFESSGGDIDKQAEALNAEIASLSTEEIQSFNSHFARMRRMAYTWDLWGAAYLIEGGCSDDGFMDFRSWLISRGRDWYSRALKDADALADYPENLQDTCASFEDFAYIAPSLYKQRTGDYPPGESEPHPSEPAGEPWPEEDDEVFKARWPKIFAKYGNG